MRDSGGERHTDEGREGDREGVREGGGMRKVIIGDCLVWREKEM